MAAAAPRALYELLFSVEVLHPYFLTPTRLRMRVEPDAATRAWMTRAGCVIRVAGNVLQVHFEAERNAPYALTTAQGDGALLRFGVYVLDPQFARFTDGLPGTDEPPLTFCSVCAVEDGGAWRLEPTRALGWHWTEGPRPDLQLVMPMAGPFTPRAAQAARPARGSLPAAPAQDAIPGRAYRLALRSRESLWKYFLLGEWSGARIVDPSDAVRFEAAPDQTLPDGRVVSAFRSTSAIPLAERFDQRFELHAPAPPGGVPIRRVLPTPAAANLARDRDPDGRDRLVSEIFVPR